MGGSVAYVRNPADILNYGGIKCYPVYWVRTRGRVVAGSKYYLNKNKNIIKMNALHLAIYFALAFIAPYFVAGLEVDVGFDRPGPAFEMIMAATPSDCALSCLSRPLCQIWTWEEKTRWCSLKETAEPRRSKPGSCSGEV